MTHTAPTRDSRTWADLTPGTWLVDQRNSAAHFEVSHALVSKIRGVIPISGGTIEVGPDLATSSVNLGFEPAGVTTGLGDRDDLLRGPNFFDVVSYPVWSFESTSISRDDHDLVVTGELTIHGQSRSQGFNVQFTGVDESQSGVPVAGFTASGQFDRRDFGLDWTAGQAGSHIRTGHKVEVTVYVVASAAGSNWIDETVVDVVAAV
ncbi:MAG: YceI family protein [Bifidobacteriaceae bacterium]|jgi:polyisoprenoid-binding protein YceI|nr:YceI family protein [Bifidobacteriaceae bacterium]